MNSAPNAAADAWRPPAERYVVLVAGPPGSGKTTTVQKALAALARGSERKPFAHAALFDGPRLAGWELGAQRGDMSGTDALAMDVQPKVLAWLAQPLAKAAPWVLAEGDRLANVGFLWGVEAAGWQPVLVVVTVDWATSRQRAADRGSRQSEAWARGRHTKVANLQAQVPHLLLDGCAPQASNVANLQRLLGVPPA